MAIDGVMIDMPDTPENRNACHKPEGGTPAVPQSRTVGLTEIGAGVTCEQHKAQNEPGS
jgi:hypothetical protein